MTSNMEILPKDEQVSDDFVLVRYERKYWAVTANNDKQLEMIASHKDKWICISNAVHRIHEFIINQPEAKRPIPYWDNDQQKVIWQDSQVNLTA